MEFGRKCRLRGADGEKGWRAGVQKKEQQASNSDIYIFCWMGVLLAAVYVVRAGIVSAGGRHGAPRLLAKDYISTLFPLLSIY